MLEQNSQAKAIYASGISSQHRWVLIDPEFQKFMLQNHHLYTKSDEIFFMKNSFFNKDIFFSDGIQWKRQRQLVSEAFHFQALQSYTPLINKITKQQIKQTKTNEIINIVSECSNIAGKVLSATFFEENFYKGIVNGKQIIDEIQDLVQSMALYKKNIKHIIKYSIFKNYSNYTFLTSNYEKSLIHRFQNLYTFIQDYVSKLIENGATLKDDQKPTSFSEIFINEYFQNKISKEEIVNNFLSFFFAGIDTTGNYTAMCFYVLGENQELQQRIYESCYNYFKTKIGQGFDPYNFEIQHEDLNKIPEINNFIKENFRFNNSAPGLLFRKVVEDHEFEGIQFKKGQIVNIITHPNMQNEKYFKNPKKFDIDRWESEEIKHLNPYAYIPFSSGQRNCLGQHLSVIEIKVMLIQYLLRYQIFKNPEKNLKIGVKIISCPVEEDLVYFENRKIKN